MDHFPEYDIYVTNTGTKDIYTQVSLTELHKLIPEENYETADVYRIEFTFTMQYVFVMVATMIVISRLPHAAIGPNDHREDAPHFRYVNEIVIFQIRKGEYRRANQQK